MMKITRQNVVIEMTAEEWDLLWDYLGQLSYSDFHQKINREASARLEAVVSSLTIAMGTGVIPPPDTIP